MALPKHQENFIDELQKKAGGSLPIAYQAILTARLQSNRSCLGKELTVEAIHENLGKLMDKNMNRKGTCDAQL